MELPRLDLYLSYWIILWLILFLSNVLQYSPKLILLLALLYSIYESYVVIHIQHFTYIFINVSIKTIALLLVINSSIDIIPTIILVCAYILYIYANKQRIHTLYGVEAIRERATNGFIARTVKPFIVSTKAYVYDRL